MSFNLENSCRLLPKCCLAFVAVAVIGGVPANAAEKVLYSFQGGNDGIASAAGLIEDNTGNLYGTTLWGGGGDICGTGYGCGTVFKLAPDGTESVLYAFQGGNDGALPTGKLVVDGAGNFYGTAGGGANNDGTIFKLAPDGTETILYAFQGGNDGVAPVGGLIADKKGNYYGTTEVGGAPCGCGTVFELASNGSKKVLYSFQGGGDGANPVAGLIADKTGNLYGTARVGGNLNCFSGGCGVVFKLAPDGTESVLHAFQGSDGEFPTASLIMDSSGNLYGTTEWGGGGNVCSFGVSGGCGTVFRVTPDGTESVLHSFQGGSDGANPEGGVVMDKAGNLYGTTSAGGGTSCKGSGCGTVFKLAPDGTETVLYAFKRLHGTFPTSMLLLKNGILYGTTWQGGSNNDGVVFSVKK